MGVGRREAAAFAAVVAVVLVALSVRYFDTDGMFGPNKISGDGWDNYSVARSLFFDKNIDITDELKNCCNQFVHPIDPNTGLPGSPHPIGTAILWQPFLLLAHAAQLVEHGADPTVRVDGYADAYYLRTAWGTLVYGVLGLALVYLTLRRRFDVAVSAAACIGVAAATPALFFMLEHPSYSHPVDLFVVALFFFVWDAAPGAVSVRRYAILGFLVGLVALVREPYGLLGFMFAADLIRYVVRGPVHERVRRLRRAFAAGAVSVATSIVAFAPQIAAWFYWYGSPFTLPQGKWFMEWTKPSVENLFNVLFWSKNGLVSWHPITGVALVGLALVFRFDRRLGAALAIGLATQLYTSVVVTDLWGGWSFGHRRLVGAAPVFALGLAVALMHVRLLAARLHPRLGAPAVFVVVLPFVVLNAGVWDRVKKREVKVAATQDMRAVYGIDEDDALWRAWEVVGNPLALPAALYHRVVFGLPLAQYEPVAGEYVLYRFEPKNAPIAETIDFAAPHRAKLAARGALRDLDGRTTLYASSDARGVARARVVVPLWLLEDDLDVELHGRLVPRDEAAACSGRLSVRVNDTTRGASAEDCSVVAKLRVPLRDVRWGNNVLDVVYEAGPGARADLAIARIVLSSKR